VQFGGEIEILTTNLQLTVGKLQLPSQLQVFLTDDASVYAHNLPASMMCMRLYC